MKKLKCLYLAAAVLLLLAACDTPTTPDNPDTPSGGTEQEKTEDSKDSKKQETKKDEVQNKAEDDKSSASGNTSNSEAEDEDASEDSEQTVTLFGNWELYENNQIFAKYYLTDTGIAYYSLYQSASQKTDYVASFQYDETTLTFTSALKYDVNTKKWVTNSEQTYTVQYDLSGSSLTLTTSDADSPAVWTRAAVQLQSKKDAKYFSNTVSPYIALTETWNFKTENTMESVIYIAGIKGVFNQYYEFNPYTNTILIQSRSLTLSTGLSFSSYEEAEAYDTENNERFAQYFKPWFYSYSENGNTLEVVNIASNDTSKYTLMNKSPAYPFSYTIFNFPNNDILVTENNTAHFLKDGSYVLFNMDYDSSSNTVIFNRTQDNSSPYNPENSLYSELESAWYNTKIYFTYSKNDAGNVTFTSKILPDQSFKDIVHAEIPGIFTSDKGTINLWENSITLTEGVTLAAINNESFYVDLEDLNNGEEKVPEEVIIFNSNGVLYNEYFNLSFQEDTPTLTINSTHTFSYEPYTKTCETPQKY